MREILYMQKVKEGKIEIKLKTCQSHLKNTKKNTN